jgi:chromosomal replication initiator protein
VEKSSRGAVSPIGRGANTPAAKAPASAQPAAPSGAVVEPLHGNSPGPAAFEGNAALNMRAPAAAPASPAPTSPLLSASALWEVARANLQAKLRPHYYKTWFEPLSSLAFDGETVRMGAPGAFHFDWIRNNYTDVLTQALGAAAGVPVRLELVVVEPQRVAEPEPSPAQVPASRVEIDPRTATLADTWTGLPLKPEFRFDEFVVGASNQFAFAAASAIAERPGLVYNPVVLFGGVGLGKTHLIQAIAHEVLESNPSMRVRYISSEQFINDYIQATRFGRMDEFRRRYRENVDMLLIDDIQFMAGKEMTQEEFFHTFNALYEARKQIVITSDKFPREIPRLEERLKNRFQWGLIADIQPPELETRVAILKEKAARSDVQLSDEVAMYIASQVQTNVRDLEGVLTTLLARASLFRTPVDMKLASDVLQPMSYGGAPRLSFERVMNSVAQHFGVNAQDLRSERRHRAVSEPRQVAVYLSRKLLNASYPEIGRQFGGRDHSTIITACRTVEARLGTDGDFKALVDRLERQLGSQG